VIGDRREHAGPVLRSFRAAIVAAAALALGAEGHVIAGGSLAGATPVVLLFSALVLSAACWALMGRQVSAPGIIGLTVAGQVFVHMMLWLACGGGYSSLMVQPAMILAHLVAASVLGAWLAYGERTVWRLIRALAFAALAYVRVAVAVPTLRGVEAASRDWLRTGARRPQALLVGMLPVRRGPPVTGALGLTRV
jgi:hypothetical protein